MVVSIHQPEMFPQLSYFNKIIKCDKFVLLDDVQFEKNNFQNRNRLSFNNSSFYITIPINYKFGMKVNEVTINNDSDWKSKILGRIKQIHRKSPGYSYVESELTRIFDSGIENVSTLSTMFIYSICKNILGYELNKFIYSSRIDTKGLKSEDRLAKICSELNADTYISGPGAKDYFTEEVHNKFGKTKVVFHEFDLVPYNQLTCTEFQPRMSVIDAILNLGIEETRKLIVGT